MVELLQDLCINFVATSLSFSEASHAQTLT